MDVRALRRVLTLLHAELGERAADLVATVLERGRPVDLVVLSGQTIWHEPRVDLERGVRTPATLQLGEPARVIARCDRPVVSDLRQGDLAEGGQGAPLVSFADLRLHAQPGVARAVHNLGGISNLTWLPPDGDPQQVLAFDTGPANCLLDEAVALRTGRSHDEDGRLASAGTVHASVLERLLAHPYLELEPPKTTGREAFHLGAFAYTGLDALLDADLLATLTAFTVASTVRAYRRWVVPRGLDEVWLAGGGALNPVVRDGLRRELATDGVRVATFEELGRRSSDREAVAFALMGYELWHGRPNTLPAATGARRAVPSGRLSLPPGATWTPPERR